MVSNDEDAVGLAAAAQHLSPPVMTATSQQQQQQLPPFASAAAAAAHSPSLDEQMQTVLELMDARARGVATNEQVEEAVACLLRMQSSANTTTTTTSDYSDPNSGGGGGGSGGYDNSTSAQTANLDSAAIPAQIGGESEGQGTTSKKAAAVAAAAAVDSAQRRKQAELLQPEIQPDMEDYDDLEDDEPAPKSKGGGARAASAPEVTSITAAAAVASSSSLKVNKNGSVAKKRRTAAPTPAVDWTVYEDIPLGKQGAQMITTFGDGRRPIPAAVSAALQGARGMLQVAIQDARHVRRKQKALYRSAKDSLKAEQPHKPAPSNKQQWSTEILFRASEGYDSLAYDPKCGFGIEDVRQLFPEEMNAYSRWNEMHVAATAADEEEKEGIVTAADDEDDGDADGATDAAATSTTRDDDDDNGGEADPLGKPHQSSDMIGHLRERASQFDLRTDKMQGEWYLKYAVLRQGSFLPRRVGAKGKNTLDATWEVARKQQQRVGGGGQQGVWAHMSAATVRFLHWVGFDPASALPPPSEDVTCALAFLGYDFYGRIVEKAIFLRNVEKQKLAGEEVNEAAALLELDPGEQLTEADILRAMEDPDIKPVPLYSSATNKKLGPQLYFGPGFEDRLEMELDEMMWRSTAGSSSSSKKVSDEDLEIRRQEDELFAQLAKPPTRDGIAALLASRDEESPERNEDLSGNAKKKQRKSS